MRTAIFAIGGPSRTKRNSRRRVGLHSRTNIKGFSPVPGVNLNGRLTLGENGADNAGLRLAFMALSSALEKGSIKDEKVEGFTPEQRFFLGYAQLWCQNARPEESLRLAQTDPHSPGRFRVDGVVKNMPEFGKAWGCSARYADGRRARMPRLVRRAGVSLLRTLAFSVLLTCAAPLAPAQLTAQQILQQKAQPSGLDIRAIDKAADPCQDFYQYACGTWRKENPIPADEAAWGRFNELHERIEVTLRGILEDSAKNQNRSADDQKIGAFYDACLDEAAIQQRGAAPLQPELKRISDINNMDTLVAELAHLHEEQVPAFFNFGSSPDPKDARMTIGDLGQGGLGLPERDYYFRDDAQSKQIREKYVALLAKLFTLSGTPASAAASDAQRVMALETTLAKASLDVTSMRNPDLLVHEMPPSALQELTPQFQFAAFFTDLKTPTMDKINVDEPDFFKAFNTLTTAGDLETIKLYLKSQYLNASSNLLPQAFVDAHFDFYGRTLRGQQQLRPRWKRCVTTTDSELGDALGRIFVERTFGKEGKERTLQLVHEIETQMGHEIESLSWMTPETKKQALVKLHAVADKIGYPEKWRNYAGVTITKDDYFGDYYRANEYENRRDLNKIGKPVDRMEWGMTPPTVNAYYDPTQNNINFPAGILQPPFYSNQADDAVNYGAIGTVIGHELTHAFDDQGRKFDADGNLTDWWQKSDAAQFTQLAGCYVNEYSNFTVLPSVHVNGQLTLGENTADNGGIRLSYLALMDQLAKRSIAPDRKQDGYTAPQQFFLGFAQVWCDNERPEAEREQVQTDPHSPAQFRVNGVVSNSPEFSEAFGCKAGRQDVRGTSMPCLVTNSMSDQNAANPLLVEQRPIPFGAIRAEQVVPGIATSSAGDARTHESVGVPRNTTHLRKRVAGA